MATIQNLNNSVQTKHSGKVKKDVKKTYDKVKSFLMKKLEYVVAVCVCLLLFAASFSTAFKSLEYKYYDAYLKIKPEIKLTKDLVMINIDDKSIEEIGTYPWSRNIVADMLVRLREFGAKAIVFDIEFLNPSSLGVNPDYVNSKLPEEYGGMQSEIISTFNDFADAVETKSIVPSQAKEIGQEMTDYLGANMDEVYASITNNIFRDNDEYFAQCLRFFGNSYLTINSTEVNALDSAKDSIEYAYENMLFDNIEDKNGYYLINNAYQRARQNREYGIGPALLSLLQSSKGGGFPNVVIDEDGVRRRFELFSEYKGKYVAQLVFVPLLQIMQPERIVRTKYSLTLKNALPPDGRSTKRHDIVIPLDDHGNVLTNWLKSTFENSFRNESSFFLYYIDQIENSVWDSIKDIADLEIKNADGYLGYHEVAEYLLDEYESIGQLKQELLNAESENFDEYIERRKVLFEDINTLLTGGFDTEIYDVFNSVREAAGDETLYADVQEAIQDIFYVLSSNYDLYMTEFERMKTAYADAFCIIGNNAVGTTDFGATPFDGYYPNVGTHANLYNTIINEDFIRPLPKTFTLVLTFVCTLLLAMLFRHLKTLNSRFISGVLILAVVVFVLGASFSMFRIYIESFLIVISLILSFIIITVARFILSEKDKNFLRKAFSTYLSGDIIDEIIKDPNKLKLGGQEKELTAIFTDVKSFSTLSEKVTPTQLVSILNKYLSRMSDIVLEHRGTIDKFEGDAIIAFYGAPVDNPEHAKMALESAIRMKQAEVELNKVLVESGEAPNALLTRIGINSGPMVVGNMGTDAKMNYTIMGNDVNLAARLEGVNKVYGTWILASEFSFNKAGPGFLGRRLDRVRVVGINTPVQLYNVMGFMDEMSQQTIDGIGVFHQALDLYLSQEFEKSMEVFNKVLEILPEDPPSLVYLDRARKLLKTGVPDGWDGVVNMTQK